MKSLRVLRWVLYPVFFLAVFFVAFYWTFPLHIVKDYVAQELEESLSASGSGASKVKIGDMSLWRVSGVQVKDIRIEMPQPGTAPIVWQVDRLRLRLGLLGLLSGTRRITFQARMYEGAIDGSVALGAKESLRELALTTENLDFKKMPLGSLLYGLPMAGRLDTDIALKLGGEAVTESSGHIKVKLTNAQVGPGQLMGGDPAMMGGFSIPAIKIGNLSLDLPIRAGQGKSKEIRLSGGDVEANVDMDLAVAPSFGSSKLTGNGWFSIDPAFLSKNGALKSLLELASDFNRAKDSAGKYYFILRGTLDHPRPRLDMSKGSANNQP